MPIRAITFDHNGQTIHAQLVYNFSSTFDAITVILEDAIEGIKQTILFIREDENWITTSDINKLHPVTTQKIIECLRNLFVCKKNSDHILSIYDFLS